MTGFGNPMKGKREVSPSKQGLLEKWMKGRVGSEGNTTIIPRRSEGEYAPLSFAQQSMWFESQLNPSSTEYHIPFMLYVSGPLRIDALTKALYKIVARHEVLRTRFQMKDDTLQQVAIPPSAPECIHFSLLNLSLLSREEGRLEAQRIQQAEMVTPFDMTKGLVIRTRIICIKQNEYIFLITLHHSVIDAWSMGIFFQELSALYNAFIAGMPDPLKPVSIQYADYAVWQQQRVQGEALDTGLAYWKTYLAEAPTLLQFPTDYARPQQQSIDCQSYRFPVAQSLVSKLKALSQQENASFFIITLAAFQVLLFRSSGQDDLLVSFPIANRGPRETKKLMGFLLNTLVLRAHLSDNPSFIAFLRHARDDAFMAYKYQDIPFEKIVDSLNFQRESNYHPLVQFMFILQDASTAQLELEGLTIQFIEVEQGHSRFDLVLNLQENAEGVSGIIQYNASLFRQETIIRISQRFLALLEDIVNHPDYAITQLSILPLPEREMLLHDWNATNAPYPKEHGLHQLFQTQVECASESVALIFEDEHVTYEVLNRRANQVAHYLRSLGVGPDVAVGIYMERSIAMITGILSIIKAGGAYVPLDPAYPSERIAVVLTDAQVPILLTMPHMITALPPQPVILVYPDDEDRIYREQSQQNLRVPTSLDNLAYIIYTSGSTGIPKGVGMTQRPLINLLTWYGKKLPPAKRLLQFASLSFDVSFSEIFGALLSGATLCLLREHLQRDSLAVVYALQEQAIEECTLPVVTLQQIAEAVCQQDLVLPALQTIISTGEQLRITHAIQEMFRRLPGCTLHNHYGPSESHVVTAFSLDQNIENWPMYPSIGRPIANVQIYVLDSLLQPVPIGVPGELYLGGICLARGYFNRPALTSEHFIANPFSDGTGTYLYKTGDIVRYQANGNIEYLGRLDHQVKLRGVRIELGEIEALLSQHCDVEDAIVLMREDEPDEKRLVAYVVPIGEQEDIVSELRRHLRGKLPAYMLPSAFVVLDSWPLTLNGKVNRQALPRPDHSMSYLSTTHTPPRTEIERMLVTIWQEVLHVEHLSIQDNFFERGGHSLLATRLLMRVNAIFKLELTLHSLFENATIAAFAKQVIASPSYGYSLRISDIRETARSATIPLSFAQQRMWFFEQLSTAGPRYHIPLSFTLHGPLNRAALENSLLHLLARHEILRTVFRLYDGYPQQVILPTEMCRNRNILFCDLQILDQDMQDRMAKQIIAKAVETPFDLAQWPLMRVILVQGGMEQHLLLVVIHHIIFDGWSEGIFLQELADLYNAATSGQPDTLPLLSLQYADFAIWQRASISGQILAEGLAYWKQQLDNAPHLLALPTDYLRPPVQTFTSDFQPFLITRSLAQHLHAFSQQEGVTLFMTLLTAFQVLLYRYSRQEDILIGIPVAGRTHIETESLIGCFINTLVVRTDLSGAPTFRALVKSVRGITLNAYKHQHIPFDQIVDRLQIPRDTSHHPIFQVMFLFNQMSTESFELRELNITPLELENTSTKFDITIGMSEKGEEIVGVFEYNTALFKKTTIASLTEHFIALLEGIVFQPDLAISKLPLRAPAYREYVRKEYMPMPCIQDAFAVQVFQRPDTTALTFGDHAITYQELHYRSNQLAHYLRRSGVGPEVAVGIYMQRSLEFVVSLLGIIKAGGAYVPLDPAYPVERLRFILQNSQIRILVTQECLKQIVSMSEAHLLCLDSEWSNIAQESTRNVDNNSTVHDLVYVIYTSGSTGWPKGVPVSHHSLLNLICWHQQAFAITASDRATHVTSPAFDAAGWELWPYLTSGASVHLPAEELRLAPELLRDWLHQNAITMTFLPTPLTEIMMQLEWPRTISLRYLLTGADTLHSYPSPALPFVLINNYGPTEATVVATSGIVPPLALADTSPSLGRPITNVGIYLLDTAEQLVPDGFVGEICIGGMGLARGYLRDPALTAEKFIPDPFSNNSGTRLYKTGDLGRYLPNGEIEFLGRLDYQVKLRGYRIELEEICVVLRAHPAVQEATAIIREDQPGDRQLVAYIVPRQNSSASDTFPDLVAAIRDFLSKRLPHYMIPTAILALQALPLTTNGKINYQALPTPSVYRTELQQTHKMPETELEQAIATIWQEVLQVKNIGLYDNFFDVGGHSLLLMQVHYRLKEIADVDMTVLDLFVYPTVAQLAEHLGQRRLETPSFAQSYSRVEKRLKHMNRRNKTTS